MTKSKLETHFGDKILHCAGCHEDILIPHNQIGGFWHLNGWTNPNGLKFSGGYCSSCFNDLHKITNSDTREQKPEPWNLWNLPAHPQLYKDAKLPKSYTPNTMDLEKINKEFQRLLTQRKQSQ